MKQRRWLRPVLVVAMIAAWLAISAVGGSTFGKLGSVQENENSAFLPSSAESTRAAAQHRGFVESDAVPGIFVIDGAGAADVAALTRWADAATALSLVHDADAHTGAVSVGDVLASPPVVIPAQDNQAVMVLFTIDAERFAQTLDGRTVGEALVQAIRADWAVNGTGQDAYFTGAAGLVTDLVGAFAGIDGILLLVAMAVVLVILLVVYRSPVLPLLVLATAGIALTAAVIVVYALARAGHLTLNGQAQGIMFILVVGATTDYALLLVARYREELMHHRWPYEALAVAWRRSLAPIAASAGTVMLALTVLLLSDLRSNSSLGPVGAIGIASALLAALTLLPALLLLGGRHARGVFWPARPHYLGDQADDATATHALEARSGLWGRISRAVDARPRLVWIGSVAVLAVMAAGLTGLHADGVGERDVFLNTTESVTGFDVLEAHFDAGSTSPVRVFVDASDADAALAAVRTVAGVERAQLLTAASRDPGGGQATDAGSGEPMVVNGRVEIDVVTATASSTRASQDVVVQVREAVRDVTSDAVVGGRAAEALDTRLTTDRDIRVIFPVILAVIVVVLALLLRSLVAPVVIVAANIVSFAAALGASTVAFGAIFHFPGMDPTVPLLAFVFLVALGVDYSIFLMSRAREEALSHGTRTGVRRALAVTGGVITSAGIVLAATFAALGVLPLMFLAQIAVIVAFGVLVDTFIVRSLLVPGLIADLGRRSWWPWWGRFPQAELPVENASTR